MLLSFWCQKYDNVFDHATILMLAEISADNWGGFYNYSHYLLFQ